MIAIKHPTVTFDLSCTATIEVGITHHCYVTVYLCYKIWFHFHGCWQTVNSGSDKTLEDAKTWPKPQVRKSVSLHFVFASQSKRYPEYGSVQIKDQRLGEQSASRCILITRSQNRIG